MHRQKVEFGTNERTYWCTYRRYNVIWSSLHNAGLHDKMEVHKLPHAEQITEKKNIYCYLYTNMHKHSTVMVDG